jgi:hypothetical protein
MQGAPRVVPNEEARGLVAIFARTHSASTWRSRSALSGARTRSREERVQCELSCSLGRCPPSCQGSTSSFLHALCYFRSGDARLTAYVADSNL